jgi:hypothetical protein
MNGRIRMRSTPGFGSVFEVLLPRAAAALPASPPAAAGASALGEVPSPSRGRVRSVEDNPVNALLMAAPATRP